MGDPPRGAPRPPPGELEHRGDRGGSGPAGRGDRRRRAERDASRGRPGRLGDGAARPGPPAGRRHRDDRRAGSGGALQHGPAGAGEPRGGPVPGAHHAPGPGVHRRARRDQPRGRRRLRRGRARGGRSDGVAEAGHFGPRARRAARGHVARDRARPRRRAPSRGGPARSAPDRAAPDRADPGRTGRPRRRGRDAARGAHPGRRPGAHPGHIRRARYGRLGRPHHGAADDRHRPGHPAGHGTADARRLHRTAGGRPARHPRHPRCRSRRAGTGGRLRGRHPGHLDAASVGLGARPADPGRPRGRRVGRRDAR